MASLPVCEHPDCKKKVMSSRSRFCSRKHRDQMRQRRYRARHLTTLQAGRITKLIREEAGEDFEAEGLITRFLTLRNKYEALAAVRGPAYEKIVERPELVMELLKGEVTYDTAGELVGYSPATVAKVVAMLIKDLKSEQEATRHTFDDHGQWLIGADVDIGLRRQGHEEDAVPKDIDALVSELADRFVAWRNEVMTDEFGEAYLTKDFHRNWIEAILRAMFTGQRLMILSPPRHGKTQLLIDFAIWLMVRHPNIRILWVASNADLARDWVASIQDQMSNNEKLRSLYLSPGADFKPQIRSGKSWSRDQFTLGTRTITGIKSPTMQAVGRGGKILSRDVDLMIIDDIEDHQSTSQPAARSDTRKWFMKDTGSRKMSHTGVCVIGSRQDPEDLYGHLLTNSEWSCIVEEAHSSKCDIDEYDEAAHVDCMLFPERNSYAWLQGQRRSMSLEGGDEVYEMVYLNRAMPRGLMVFDEKAMRSCIDPERDVRQIPSGSLLIAGVDPSVAGYQAAFLWGYQQARQQLHMIDFVADTGPGIPGFLEILAAWTQAFPALKHWVVEQNAFQRGYLIDREVREFRDFNGLTIEGHETQQNKWDPLIGVGAMARLYKTTREVESPLTGMTEVVPAVTLPGASPEAVAKVDAYIRQAKHFASGPSQTRVSTSAGYRSDILMASWFPMKVIRRAAKEWQAEVEWTYEPSYAGFQQNTWTEVPWR